MVELAAVATGPVKSVEKALRLLEALNLRAVSSVDQLHRDLGLPKPTLVRMLKTLVAAGYVTNDRRQGGYQLTAQVRSLSCGFHSDPLVVEASRAWAMSITQRVKWPVAVCMLDGDAIRVRFSTIPDSPISPFYATVNRRLCLVSRALGRAYLAFCPEDERQILMSMVAAARSYDPAVPFDRDYLETVFAKTRAQGFAERDPVAEPRNSATLATPIMQGGRVLATIGVTFFASAMSRSEAVAAYVPLLQEASREISEHVSRIGQSQLADPETLMG